MDANVTRIVAPYTLVEGWCATMMWGYWGGSSGGWLGPVLMVAFWVLVIAGIVALVRSFSRHEAEPDRAQQILRERYARGEISRAELGDLQQGLGTK